MLNEAVDTYVAAGDRGAAGRAMLARAEPLRLLGIGWTDWRETVENLEVAGPSLALGRALLRLATGAASWARYDESRDYLRRVPDIADAIEAAEPMAAKSLRAGCLSINGLIRGGQGDLGGLDDFRQAIELGTAAGDGDRTLSKDLNYAILAGALVGPGAALRIVEEGLAFARPRGLLPDALFLEVNQTHFLYDAGLHDRALAVIPEIDRRLEETGSTWVRVETTTNRVLIQTLRGEPAAEADSEFLLDWARRDQDADAMIGGLGAVAAARLLIDGDAGSARQLLDELIEVNWAEANICGARLLPVVTRLAITIGEIESAARFGDGLTTLQPARRAALATRDAALQEARSDRESAAAGYTAALATWQQLGMVVETAFAQLGLGRTLLGLRRMEEAADLLAAARSTFADLQAAPAIAEIDNLLSQPGVSTPPGDDAVRA